MRVYEEVAQEFRRRGIERVFGLMGEDVAELIVELDRVGIPFFAARHENQAIGMADGYSRVGERLGVAFVTAGSGLFNGLTMIKTASRARSRVLVITGATAADDSTDPTIPRVGKTTSVLGVCAAAGIAAAKPRQPAEVTPMLRQAIDDAESGKVVVFTVLPSLLEAEAPPSPVAADPSEKRAPAQVVPDSEQIELVADLLGETWAFQRPLILAGRGAVQSGAGPALRQLAERIGAALATTLPARSLFEGDEFNLGISGTYSSAVAIDIITQSDIVLAFGATLNALTTYGNDLYRTARMIQIDTDDGAFGKFTDVEPELRIRGDARAAAEALLAEVERRGIQHVGARTLERRERLLSFDAREEFRDASLVDKIDPRTLTIELERIFPREHMLVIDPGHHMSATTRYFDVRRPQDFVLPIEAGSIGSAMGEAIGATMARPGVPCVVGEGDAGLMMSLADLETAVRYSCPVIIVVVNDQALGAEVHYLEMHGKPSDLARCSTPSFAAVAQALGAEGYTVKTVEDVAALAPRFQQPMTGPIVLDCYVNPEVRSDSLEIAFRSLGENAGKEAPQAVEIAG